jgi:small subunit ribosomal protein S7
MKQSLKTKSLLNVNPLLNANNNSSVIGLPEKFINLLMKHGKKGTAYTILYQALSLVYVKNLSLNIKNPDLNGFIKKNADKSMFMKKILLQAIENIQPSVEIRNVKVSGRTYQVPSIIYRKRQQILAIRWIIDFAKERKKKSSNSFSECLALELFEALKNSGKVKQKKDRLHQQAESNRAYMRYKWW